MICDRKCIRGVISTFSWGAKIFFIFQCHRTIEKLEKQHFICSNLTLFIVPFFLFFSFISLFSFFLSFFFFFSFSLGATAPPAPPNDASEVYNYSVMEN